MVCSAPRLVSTVSRSRSPRRRDEPEHTIVFRRQLDQDDAATGPGEEVHFLGLGENRARFARGGDDDFHREPDHRTRRGAAAAAAARARARIHLAGARGAKLASGQAPPAKRSVDLAAHYLADVIRRIRDNKGARRQGDRAVVRTRSCFRAANAGGRERSTVHGASRGATSAGELHDFLTSDGEKPNREQRSRGRDARRGRAATRSPCRAGKAAFAHSAGEALGRARRPRTSCATFSIRGERGTVVVALNRAMTHVSWHVGQMVWMAKTLPNPRARGRSASRAVKSRQAGTPPISDRSAPGIRLPLHAT